MHPGLFVHWGKLREGCTKVLRQWAIHIDRLVVVTAGIVLLASALQDTRAHL